MLDQILDLFSFVESRLSNDMIAVNDTPINNDKGTYLVFTTLQCRASNFIKFSIAFMYDILQNSPEFLKNIFWWKRHLFMSSCYTETNLDSC